jgi:glyoxylase I family protein
MTPSNYEAAPWSQRAGPTVFEPFPETTDDFGDSARMWMVNFRVGNLPAMVAHLRAAGIAVEEDRASI